MRSTRNFLLLLLLAKIGAAQIAYDNSHCYNDTSGANPYTVSYTVNGNSNGTIFVSILSFLTNTRSITYAGKSFTKFLGDSQLDGGHYFAMYRVVGNAAGAHNLVVSGDSSSKIVCVASYTGANQTTQPDNSAVNGNIANTGGNCPANGSLSDRCAATLTPVADNTWIVAMSWENSTSALSAYNGTLRTSAGDASRGTMAIVDTNGPIHPAASTTIGTTGTYAGSQGVMIASINPAPAGTPPAITTSCPLPNATIGSAYSQTLAATGDTPITWSVTAGALPLGLILSPNGNLTGTPPLDYAGQTSTFTLTATNVAGNNSQSCTLTTVAATSCTATVTAPTAASTQSGLVDLTMTSSSCPSLYSAEWILNDSYRAGLVTTAPYTLLQFNTGTMLDGPENIKVILRDATGAIIGASPDVKFFIKNFGLGDTFTVSLSSSYSGAVDFQSTPTVGGTISFGWTTTYPSAGANLENISYNVDGQQISTSGNYQGGTFAYDSTNLLNGLHIVSSVIECVPGAGSPPAGCGTLDGISAGTIPRGIIAFVVNVQNGSVVRDVQPNIENVALKVGDTYTLSPVLSMTDGSTTPGTFTYSLDHACIGTVRSQQQLPFPCASGNAWPFTSAQGPAYISLSAAGPTSSPITITALALGQSYITVTDTVSGKTKTVMVVVKDTLATRHFGNCGAIYTSYTPGGACPSIFRTSPFNTDLTDTALQPHFNRAGWTAWENGWWVDPGNGGGTPYANFNAWQTFWHNNYETPLNTVLTNLPGSCLILRGESLTQQFESMIEAQLGPSAQGGANWPTDPLPYSLGRLQATNRICGSEQRDEADQGYGGNPNYSMKFADNSVSKIVCKSNVCMVYPGTGNYPATMFYGAWNRFSGLPTFIKNATTSALNGNHNTSCWYHSEYNTYLALSKTITAVTNTNPVQITINSAWDTPGDINPNQRVYIYQGPGAWSAINGNWYPGSLTLPGGTTFTIPVDGTSLGAYPGGAVVTAGNCADPNTNADVGDSFTFPATVADGCYNGDGSGGCTANPNLEILGWGDKTGWANSGSQRAPNNMFKYIVDKFRAAGIPQTWPNIAQVDIIAALTYQTTGSTGMADYFTGFIAPPCSAVGAGYYGALLSNTQFYNCMYARKWGSGKGYWRGEGKGYVSAPQTVPQIAQVGIMDVTYKMQGVKRTISTISGSTLTTTTPHGVPTVGGGSFNYIKVTIAGNSDSTMNGHWYAIRTGASTFRLYASGATSCTPSGNFGTATIRGVAYTITNGYGQLVTGTNMPPDLVPGESVVISGAGASCANTTFAFAGYNGSLSNIAISPFANGSGSGGTEVASYGQGVFDPLHDSPAANGGTRKDSYAGQILYTAGLAYAGARAYGAGNVGNALGQWKVYWPQGSTDIQAAPMPDANAPPALQERWWALTPALNLLKNRPSLYLQNAGPSPWIAPGPPYVVATTMRSATYGNSLTVWNASDIPQTVSVPLGSYCQIGTNPISVYEIDYPHSTTTLLTGAQTNYSLTMTSGEVDVFACHASTASFVQPVSFRFSPPAGTATTAVQVVYGNYNQPLASYARSVSGSSSPITLNLDTSWSDVWFRFQYLDSSNAVIASSDFEQIPQH